MDDIPQRALGFLPLLRRAFSSIFLMAIRFRPSWQGSREITAYPASILVPLSSRTCSTLLAMIQRTLLIRHRAAAAQIAYFHTLERLETVRVTLRTPEAHRSPFHSQLYRSPHERYQFCNSSSLASRHRSMGWLRSMEVIRCIPSCEWMSDAVRGQTSPSYLRWSRSQSPLHGLASRTLPSGRPVLFSIFWVVSLFCMPRYWDSYGYPLTLRPLVITYQVYTLEYASVLLSNAEAGCPHILDSSVPRFNPSSSWSPAVSQRGPTRY